MTKNQELSNFRIQELEKGQSEVVEKVDKILVNHLPHLKEQLQTTDSKLTTQIEALKVRVNLGIGINVLMFVGTILGIILLVK
jgi:hypothetical protein